MQAFLRHLKTQQKEMVGLLERFVKCESPSYDKAAVDAFGRIVAEEWKQRGAKVQILRQPKRGDQIRAEIWLGEGKPTWTNYDPRPPRHGISRRHFGQDAISCGARPRLRSRNIRHEGRACAGAIRRGCASRCEPAPAKTPRFLLELGRRNRQHNFQSRNRARSAPQRCGASAGTFSRQRWTPEDRAQRRWHCRNNRHRPRGTRRNQSRSRV